LPRLLICNHGVYGGAGSAEILAAKVDRRERFDGIDACCLRGDPCLEDVVESARGHPVYLVPNLMADGYAMSVMRDRAEAAAAAAGAPLFVAPPLGLCPKIPDVISALAVEACERKGRSPRSSHLLIIGHGSQRSERPAEVTRQHAGVIAGRNKFAGVDVGFLDESPTVREAYEAVSGRPLVIVGLFADAGPHGKDDVPELLGAVPEDVFYAGPTGPTAPFADLLQGEVDNLCRQAAAANDEEC
jgi:sirohydrochlorin ferrochelatase